MTPCVKRCYDSEASAKARVAQIKRGRVKHKFEPTSRREYYPVFCPRCRLWHLLPEAGVAAATNWKRKR